MQQEPATPVLKKQEPNQTLVASSVFLALPGIMFILRAEYTQATISFLCSFFSMLWHGTKPRYNWILLTDMFFANSTALLAIHTCARGSYLSALPVSGFIGGALVLYYYGQRNLCFCWHPDNYIATKWHTVLHVGNGLMGCWLVYLIK